MSYCVIRTDDMSGVKQPADLVSLRFYPNGEAVGAVENGTIVELMGYETSECLGAHGEDQREVMMAFPATSKSKLNNCAIVAGVELMYDERKRSLDEYINEAGKAVRGYIPRSRNIFSVTADGFVNKVVPAVGGKVGIGAGGKIDAGGTGLGECVHIETAGKYTFYAIKIDPTEVNV